MLLSLALALLPQTPISGNAAVQDVDTTRRTVWSRGESGYHTFRIPAVIAAPSGDLLAFCEGRKNGQSDSGDIDLVMKRSADGGATWSENRVLWDDGDNVCGNPCPVIDASTGTIHLLATRNLGSDKEHQIIAGTSKGTRTVWVLTSTDSGKTWSEPRDVTPTTKKPDWTWYATGPGIGIQLVRGEHAGRLVIPCDHIEAKTKHYYSHALLSDDHGKTWRIGGRSTRHQLNECQVAELSTGELVMNMRNYDRAKKTRAVMRSADGGETWGKVQWDESLPDPICQAGLVAVHASTTGKPTDDSTVLYFSNCASESKRIRMTLRKSLDGGHTWSEGRLLHAGPSAYSCLVALHSPAQPHRIGCLFECGSKSPYERIDWAIRP